MRSPELEAAAAVLAQSIPLMLSGLLDNQRLAYDALALLYPPPLGTETRPVDAGGVPAELVRAPGVGSSTAVLHLHGGGYGIGSAAGYRGFAARLSAACSSPVLVPDYRLAPEAPFPAAVEDAERAYSWLVGEVGDPARLGVSGDSAGGGLALSLLTGGAGPGAPRPGALVLWSPWADLEVADGRDAGVEDPVLTVAWLQERAAAYLDGADPKDPAASPVHAELSGLPPTLVLVGSDEILRSDARRVVEGAGGADMELFELAGGVHLWPHFVPEAPESAAALELAGRFLFDRLRPARAT